MRIDTTIGSVKRRSSYGLKIQTTTSTFGEAVAFHMPASPGKKNPPSPRVLCVGSVTSPPGLPRPVNDFTRSIALLGKNNHKSTSGIDFEYNSMNTIIMSVLRITSIHPSPVATVQTQALEPPAHLPAITNNVLIFKQLRNPPYPSYLGYGIDAIEPRASYSRQHGPAKRNPI